LLPATIQPGPIHYLPIATTVLCAIFFTILLRHYLRTGGAHLAWWSAGVFFYGLGTGLESAVTLLGNSILLTKTWYIAGALLGGYALAQGTVYLLLPRRTANILTAITVPFVALAAVAVIMSPASAEALEPHRPTGEVIGWQWIRYLTPPINIYAVLFLVGGAMLSAVRYAKKTGGGNRALGNASIAFGALLPAIGGTLTKTMGLVEALYVGELIGIIFIWLGYALCVHSPGVRGRTNSAR
jgi:hypothetical protein